MSSSSSASAALLAIAGRGRVWIDGEYRAAEGGRTLPVLSPRDGKPFAEIANASAADVDSAVAAARRCLEGGWGAASNLPQRIAAMEALAAAIREPATLAGLTELESLDCGKPLGEAEGDIEACAGYFDYFASIAPAALATEPLATDDDDFVASLSKEPVGVVGCVTPWNYPLMQAVLKVAPALVAGCTVVLKPAPNASLACVALGQLAASAGFPAGALNVITGGPPDTLDGGGSTGQSLIDHGGLDKLSFTGSGVAGQKMLTASAQHLRPTSLELGGKSPVVVFDDARDIMPALLDWLMLGIFFTSGQVCSATSRLIVQDTLHDELVAQLKAAAAELVVGDPLAEGTQMGPLVSAAQMEKVKSAVELAEAQGATVHRGAQPLSLGEDLEGGYYVPPTILADVALDSDAWLEEIFGPVLSVAKFSTEDEAVALANATDYGLAAAVFSTDTARCASVADKLEAGVVWQNCSQVLFTTTPFGGKQGKKSGFGHELGEAGLHEYINTKTIVGAVDGASWEFYGETSKPRDLG